MDHQREQCTQVVQVQQQQAAVVGQLEHDVEYAGLGVVELQNPGEQGGAHLADGGTYRMPELAIQVPEHHRVSRWGVVGHARIVGALQHAGCPVAGHGQAGDIAFYIGQEHRNAQPREAFGQGHQGHGLAGAGGAGHQPVAIAEAGFQHNRDVVGDAFAEQERGHCADPVGKGRF